MRRCAVFVLWALAASASGGKSEGWGLVVRPCNSGGPERLYWIGLRNTSGEPRAFCQLGVTYMFDLRNGNTVAEPVDQYPGVRSPHPCAAGQGHLVLPGETHFVRVAVPVRKEAAVAPHVRFEVTAEETCVEAGECEAGPLIILQQP
jgi:hypothetical protein